MGISVIANGITENYRYRRLPFFQDLTGKRGILNFMAPIFIFFTIYPCLPMATKSIKKDSSHSHLINMEQLKDFKSFDLHEKLRLNENDFDAWLEELGLLHGKRTY